MSLVAQNLPFHHCISFDRDSSTSNADDNISDDALCNLTMFRLRFASWVAGRKLGGPGAQGALPSAKDVDECLGVTYASVQEKLTRGIDWLTMRTKGKIWSSIRCMSKRDATLHAAICTTLSSYISNSERVPLYPILPLERISSSSSSNSASSSALSSWYC